MDTFVELTPDQADLLMQARYYEENRIRHEKEEWDSQVQRDIRARDIRIELAILKGVPLTQIQRFIGN